MLREKASTDAHFAMYHQQDVWVARCTKNGDNGPLNFDIAAYDLDFGGHQRRPNADDFVALVRKLWIIDQTPNLVYQTRGGARIIYCIERLTDPDEFEEHYQSLLKKLAASFKRHGHGYEVDEQAKDWTRLFRCPLVTRDGTPEFHYHIREYHTDKLDLRSFKTVRKTKPKFVAGGNRDFTGSDPYVCKLLRELGHGNRNNTTFKAAAWVVSKYKPEAAERLLNLIANAASAAGLPDREIDQVINSARKVKK